MGMDRTGFTTITMISIGGTIIIVHSGDPTDIDHGTIGRIIITSPIIMDGPIITLIIPIIRIIAIIRTTAILATIIIPIRISI